MITSAVVTFCPAPGVATLFWSTTDHRFAYNARIHKWRFNLSSRAARAIPTGFLPRQN